LSDVDSKPSFQLRAALAPAIVSTSTSRTQCREEYQRRADSCPKRKKLRRSAKSSGRMFGAVRQSRAATEIHVEERAASVMIQMRVPVSACRRKEL
jgi:hypothetical protein